MRSVRTAFVLIILVCAHAHLHSVSAVKSRSRVQNPRKDAGNFDTITKVLVPLGILSLPTVLGSGGLNILDHSTTPSVSGQQQQQQQQQQAHMMFTNQPAPGLLSTGLSTLFGSGSSSSLLSPDIPDGTQSLSPRHASDSFGRISSGTLTATALSGGAATASSGSADGQLYRRLPGLSAPGPTTTGAASIRDQTPKIIASFHKTQPPHAKPLTKHADDILGPQALAQQMAHSITPDEDKSYDKLPSGSVLTQLNTAADMLGLPSMNALKLDGFNKVVLDNLDNLKYRDADAMRKQLKLTNEPVVHFDMRTQRHLIDPMPGDDEVGEVQHVQPHPGAWSDPKPYDDVNLGAAQQQQHDALAQGVPFTE